MTDARDDSPADTATDGLLPAGFSHRRQRIEAVDGPLTLAYSIGGEGPPLLLLHGYPETRVTWHRVASALAHHFTLVMPDLRGYGDSDAPESPDGARYAKAIMARDMIALMEVLGFRDFHLAGHDRGARVAYRLALSHPARVRRLAVLGINPTAVYYDGVSMAFGMKAYHWFFLPQPYPLPERMIGADPGGYIRWTLDSWLDAGATPLDPRAVALYCRKNGAPEHVHGICADYRAGATVDYADDKADEAAGRMIAAPTLVLWGSKGFAVSNGDPLAIWRRWARSVTGRAVDSGHFIPEEDPAAVITAFLEFFGDAGAVLQ